MKRYLLSFTFSFILVGLTAQDIVQVSVGRSYSQQAFYRLSDDSTTTLHNESWDLAFTTGLTDAGILYNESALVSFTGPAPILRLYLAPTENFEDVIDPSELFDSLYNTEISWHDGAFNSFRDTANPFDFGWGVYEDRKVQGEYVFALKLRDDTWKKIEIMTLSKGVYTFRYADLDGSNEVTQTLDKADFRNQGAPFAFFSFETEKFEASPGGWDLLFGRYVEALYPGEPDEPVQYGVTGALHAFGAEVVEARGIDPDEVVIDSYVDSFKTELNVIGQDWKYFDLGAGGWVLDETRAFFIKLEDNHLWKMVFIDFEGSSTGVITFTKTDLGEFTAVNDPQSNFKDILVTPNPNNGQFTYSFSLKNSVNNMEIFLVDNMGNKVWSTFTNANKDLNVLNLQLPVLKSGAYHIVSGIGNDIQSTSIIIE